MVVIRLSRSGAKKRPFFNIVVTESRHYERYRGPYHQDGQEGCRRCSGCC